MGGRAWMQPERGQEADQCERDVAQATPIIEADQTVDGQKPSGARSGAERSGPIAANREPIGATHKTAIG